MIRLTRVHLCLALFILAVISTITAVLLCAHQVLQLNHRKLNENPFTFFKLKETTPSNTTASPTTTRQPRFRFIWSRFMNLTGYDEDPKMTASFQINSGDWHLVYIEDTHHQQINHQDPHNCQWDLKKEIWGGEKETGGCHQPQTALTHGLGKSRLFWNCWQRTEDCCNRFFISLVKQIWDFNIVCKDCFQGIWLEVLTGTFLCFLTFGCALIMIRYNSQSQKVHLLITPFEAINDVVLQWVMLQYRLGHDLCWWPFFAILWRCHCTRVLLRPCCCFPLSHPGGAPYCSQYLSSLNLNLDVF